MKLAIVSTISPFFSMAATAGLLWAHPAHAESLGFSVQGPMTGQLTTIVLDDQTGQPLQDVKVESTACAVGSCFDVTASKSGYTTTTVLGVVGSQLALSLKPLPGPTVTVSGQVAGWREIPEPLTQNARLKTQPSTLATTLATMIRAGLAFRTLTVFDLLHFDLGSIISPLKDTIDVLGSREVPSNLVMPRQSVWTIVGPITLNKPNYRLPLAAGRETRLSTLQGEISVGDVTSIIQDGKLKPDAVNKLKFTRVGVTPPFTPSGADAIAVSADQDLATAHQVTVERPAFQADVIVAAVTDTDGSRETLIPTDLKAVSASAFQAGAGGATVSLKSCARSCGRSQAVVTLAFVGKGEKICGIISPAAGSSVSPGSYLCADDLPASGPLPASVGLQAGARGVASAVFETESGAGDQLRSYPIWVVHALPAAGLAHVETAAFPDRARIRSYSVMKLEFEGGLDEHAIDGKSVMTQLKRFGRSASRIGN